ncbi:MAG: PIN domain nuclease [Phototrophicales bacterium]|nr:MAG: PIN domain nuclease [Phototrophicales bacterium]
MSLEYFFRIIGMTFLAAVGAAIGDDMANAINLPTDASVILFFTIGAVAGLTITPWVTTRPARALQHLMVDTSAEKLVASLLGVLFGLILAVLMAYPLSLLPNPSGQYLPALVALGAGYGGLILFGLRAPDIFALIRALVRGESYESILAGEILLDTSVIIDGRILDIAKTGFIRQKLIIPQFVIRELQQLADSSDMLLRQRGRHGLDVLNRLRQESKVVVEVIDDIPSEGTDVDEMLVALARERGHVPIMTHDMPLNKIASLRGVDVLNINDLALALRPVYLPGETINLHIIQEGKEADQGIGYLVDGTMVVVEGGKAYRDRTIPAVITRYIISPGGKMYFAQPANMSNK